MNHKIEKHDALKERKKKYVNLQQGEGHDAHEVGRIERRQRGAYYGLGLLTATGPRFEMSSNGSM